MTRLILAAVAFWENRRRCIIVLAEDAMSALVRLILNRSREKSFHTPRNVLSGERWPGMTKGRNKKTKAKVEFTGWKAPNKRKHLVGTKAQAARSTIITEEPAAPSRFWPFEVLRWRRTRDSRRVARDRFLVPRDAKADSARDHRAFRSDVRFDENCRRDV
jgi:hypothetical protein